MHALRRLRWSELATRDLSRIAHHVAASSPTRAAKLVDAIEAKVRMLVNYPAIGRIGTQPNTRELVVHRHYLVIYRVLPGQISILRVKHAARRRPG